MEIKDVKIKLMFNNFRKEILETPPPRALVIFTWIYIFVVLSFALIVTFLDHQGYQGQSEPARGVENKVSLSPYIYSVIVPLTSSPGNEIIIRGGKFGSRGQVCFRLLQEQEESSVCPYQFEVLVWTSGSIRAKIPEIGNGEGKLWVVMGEGGKSNEVSFSIE